MSEYVTVAKTTRGSPCERYHTRDCSVTVKRPKEIPKAKAEERGLEECDVCKNGATTGQRKRNYHELVENLRDEMGVETQA